MNNNELGIVMDSEGDVEIGLQSEYPTKESFIEGLMEVGYISPNDEISESDIGEETIIAHPSDTRAFWEWEFAPAGSPGAQPAWILA